MENIQNPLKFCYDYILILSDCRPQQKDTVYNVYRTVCGPGLMLLWPFPCRRVRSSSAAAHLYVWSGEQLTRPDYEVSI